MKLHNFTLDRLHLEEIFPLTRIMNTLDSFPFSIFEGTPFEEKFDKLFEPDPRLDICKRVSQNELFKPVPGFPVAKKGVCFNGSQMSFEEYKIAVAREVIDVCCDAETLQREWETPESRSRLVAVLVSHHFLLCDLEKLREHMNMEECDMLDFLKHIAFDKVGEKPLSRVERVKNRIGMILRRVPQALDKFCNYVLDKYKKVGETILSMSHLPEHMLGAYEKPMPLACATIGVTEPDVERCYANMQYDLYCPALPIVYAIENAANCTFNGTANYIYK